MVTIMLIVIIGAQETVTMEVIEDAMHAIITTITITTIIPTITSPLGKSTVAFMGIVTTPPKNAMLSNAKNHRMKVRAKAIIIIEETTTGIIIKIVTAAPKKITKFLIIIVDLNKDKITTIQGIIAVVVNPHQLLLMIPILKRISTILKKYTIQNQNLRKTIFWTPELKLECKLCHPMILHLSC
jgi:hypothetical protein